LQSTRFGYKNFSARGRPGDVGPLSVNLGPPNISESAKARMLKLILPLDILKYSPRVQKFFRQEAYTWPPNVNVGFLKFRKLLETKKIKSTITYCEVFASGTKISPLGGVQGRKAP